MTEEKGNLYFLITRSGIKSLLIQSRHDGVINFDCAVKMKDVLIMNNNDCKLHEVQSRHNTHSLYTAGCFLLKEDETLNKIFEYIDKLQI